MFTFLYSMLLGFFEVFPLSAQGLDTLLSSVLGDRLPAVSSAWIFGTLLGTLAVFYRPARNTAKGFGTMLSAAFAGKFKWRKATAYQIMSVYSLLCALPLAAMLFVLQELGIGSGPVFIGLMFLASAALLFIGDHTVCRHTPLTEMTASQCIKSALFQAVALLPGLSRVGVTLGMGLNMGFRRKDAFDFAVMLTLPALLVLGLWNMGSVAAAGRMAAFLSLAGAAAGAALGGLALKWLYKKDLLNIPVALGALAGVATIIYSFVR